MKQRYAETHSIVILNEKESNKIHVLIMNAIRCIESVTLAAVMSNDMKHVKNYFTF